MDLWQETTALKSMLLQIPGGMCIPCKAPLRSPRPKKTGTLSSQTPRFPMDGWRARGLLLKISFTIPTSLEMIVGLWFSKTAWAMLGHNLSTGNLWNSHHSCLHLTALHWHSLHQTLLDLVQSSKVQRIRQSPLQKELPKLHSSLVHLEISSLYYSLSRCWLISEIMFLEKSTGKLQFPGKWMW